MRSRGILLISASAVALLAGVASGGAADLAAKAKAPAAAPGSWTGFYIGAYTGAAIVDSWWGSASGPLSLSPIQTQEKLGTASGAVIGGQIGYNYQIGSYLLGVEADIGTGSLYSVMRCGRVFQSACTADTDMLGTVAARLGYAFDNMLIYGKAGLAVAHDDYTLSGNTYSGTFTGAQTRTGWTVGAGVEMALTPSLSAKAEYAYLDFGSSSADLANGFVPASISVAQSAQMVKLGLNWHPGATALPGTGPAPASPGRDWSGFYLGAHAGGAWGRDDWSDPQGLLAAAPIPGAFPGGGTAMGLLGGGQLGFNVQTGALVAGVEATAAASSIGGYAKCAGNNADGSSFACRDTVKTLGTLSGRIGQSFGDALLYAKAGAAWAAGTSDVHQTYGGPPYTASGTRWGWMLGAGVEYAMTQNISAFIEYDYMDFGSQQVAFSGFGQTTAASLDQRLDVVRMGVNYRFGAAGPAVGKAPSAPALPVGWTAEVGARYFASTGRMQKDLFSNTNAAQLNSRLIYGDTTGQSAETFFRFENFNGVFLKGFAGLGTLSGGKLFDEDFPPAIDPYSNTLTEMHAGSLAYGAIDLGYDVLRAGGGSLGAFVGYRGYYNSVTGYGCRQVGPGGVCASPDPATLVALGLSETESWQGLALGVNARLPLADRVRLEVDAAYLPFVVRGGFDNHWFRSDVNPLPDGGRGWGTQVEAILSYAVTDRLDVGIGGRYWFFATDEATSQFPGSRQPSAMTFYTERYGAFLQASYRFGDLPTLATPAAIAKAKVAPAPASWTGFYLGGSLGGGKGHSTYASPFPTPVRGDAADLGGALAGGQIGADYQFGGLVAGAEASLAWANAEGTNTCFSTALTGAVPEPTGFNCGSRVNALGTLTGRLGYAFDRTLFYARGGFAWDQQHDIFNTTPYTRQKIGNSSTNSGWTLGGGIEYALLPNLSVGVEYKHFDFGASSAFTTTTPASLAGVNLAPDGLRLDMVSMTMNYRFWGAGAQ
ncbi:outer membrane beta-barrel protein [Xanthobacter sp. KR7-65]|uniref:outer membrane protein n=1 Tax=Xanthobacter sp. KR7-65 TaxID=3156612 RepID=UPI0032B5E008